MSVADCGFSTRLAVASQPSTTLAASGGRRRRQRDERAGANDELLPSAGRVAQADCRTRPRDARRRRGSRRQRPRRPPSRSCPRNSSNRATRRPRRRCLMGTCSSRAATTTWGNTSRARKSSNRRPANSKHPRRTERRTRRSGHGGPPRRTRGDRRRLQRHAEIAQSAELFDPVAGAFTKVPTPMLTVRDGPAAAVLPDGRVLIACGAGERQITRPRSKSTTLQRAPSKKSKAPKRQNAMRRSRPRCPTAAC